MDLQQLIATVEETADEPLGRIEAASTIREQIERLSDELLDHVVKEARAAGCSWAQIGDALGVTRQAAQQRHGGLAVRLLRDDLVQRNRVRERQMVHHREAQDEVGPHPLDEGGPLPVAPAQRR